MAQIKTVELIDDLDESTADETVEFALAGRSYEIDLSEANASKLRDALKPFVTAARRVSGTGRARQPRAGRPSTARREAQAIREWARGQGMDVADRGRIPVEVLIRHEQAGSPAVARG